MKKLEDPLEKLFNDFFRLATYGALFIMIMQCILIISGITGLVFLIRWIIGL